MTESKLVKIENSIIIGQASDVNKFLLNLCGREIVNSIVVLDSDNDNTMFMKERREILKEALKSKTL